MVEISTDSYPKPPALPAQKSLLDNVNQFQDTAIKQQQFQSNQLNLVDTGLKYLSRAIGSLGPNASKDQYLGVGQDMVKLGLVPPNTLNIYADRLAKAPTSQDFYNEIMTATADHQQQIDYHLGRNNAVNTGQGIQPVVTSPKPGFGMRSTGLPIQLQGSPTQIEYDENGQPRLRGNRVDAPAQGGVVSPPPASGLPVTRPAVTPPGPINNPAIPGPSSNFGGTVIGATAEPPTFADRYSPPQPRGALAGTTPLFDEGKKQLTEDQALATQKLTGIKNAQQALKLLPGVASGPGTGPYQQATAFLKAQGIIPTNENDPTVIYQEINKYLNRYVQGSSFAQRSDAAQNLAEASNPNLMTQLNPALLNLTKKAIALDKVEASRPGAFQGQNYSQYGKFRSTYPAQIDERAFEIENMEPKQRNALITDMKNKKDTPEGRKFWKSLAIADKQGLLAP